MATIAEIAAVVVGADGICAASAVTCVLFERTHHVVFICVQLADEHDGITRCVQESWHGVGAATMQDPMGECLSWKKAASDGGQRVDVEVGIANVGP